MTMPKNINRAEKAIAEMPYGLWVDIRSIARNAGLGVQTMSKYLVQARRRGTVQNKRVPVPWGRLHVWRRIA